MTEKALYIYQVECECGNYKSEFLLTTIEEYPQEFQDEFCKDLLETVKKEQIKNINSLLPKPIPEDYLYQKCTMDLIGKSEIKRMDYRIITINEPCEKIVTAIST